jgi:hypothetical protein
MKEYNTEEYFKKHGFADGGYVNKCEPKFRKEFFCEFPKEPNFSMIKPTYNINDIVRGHNRDINYLIIGIVFAYNLGEAEYTLQNIDTKETHYNIPEYVISGLVRSPKYKKGDIIEQLYDNATKFEIKGVQFNFADKDFVYSYVPLNNPSKTLTQSEKTFIYFDISVQAPSCEKIISSKNGITEEELSKAIVLYKILKTI